MSLADLGTEAGKREITKIFTEQLKFKRTRYSAALGETFITTVDKAHNEYLQILVNFGIMRLLASGSGTGALLDSYHL